MTKQEAKEAALRWLDEATSGGRALETGMTADLEERMDHLLDAAVAAVCGRFPQDEVFSVACEEAVGTVRQPEERRITLPQDLVALTEVRYSCDGVSSRRFSDYRRAAAGVYIVPALEKGQLDFSYIRAPKLLGATAPESALLDVRPEAAVLVPLRLAADLLTGVDETAALAGYLAERYNALAASIYRRPEPEPGAVECVYDW